MGVPYNYTTKTASEFEGGKQIVNRIKKVLNSSDGLYLCGAPGSGKTHLLASSMRALVYTQKLTGLQAKFRSVPEILLELKASFSREHTLTRLELVEQYSYIPYLFLDDLGAENVTDFSIEAFYIILNNRIANSNGGLRTFITSNYDLKQLQERMNDRISSRILEHCKIIKLTKPDYRDKSK
jgi:DNA replication protein DnaC